MIELTECQKQEINIKAACIAKLYDRTNSIKSIAQKFGMKNEEVSKVLNAMGYWHGIDRTTEPHPNFVFVVPSDLREFAYLL